MVLEKNGQSATIDGVTYAIGMEVVGTEESEYAGLIGYITEIRTGRDMETENAGPDIYCDFLPPDDPDAIAELESTFSDLYDEPKTIDDICLDCVIMAPSMIAPTVKSVKSTEGEDKRLAAEILKFTFGIMERNRAK